MEAHTIISPMARCKKKLSMNGIKLFLSENMIRTANCFMKINSNELIWTYND